MDLPFYEKEKLDPAFPFLAWARLKPSFWFPLHWHAQAEILQVLSGRLDVIISGERREGLKGDIVTVDTGLVHGFSNPEPGTGVRIFQFGLEIFSGALPELQEGAVPVFGRKPLLSRREDGPLHRRAEQLLGGIFNDYQRRGTGYRLSVLSRLYEFAGLLLREISPDPAPAERKTRLKTNHDRLDRIFAFINGNFENPGLSLEMAAEQACLNKFYFSRFLKEQTGQSFLEYLSRIRLHRAEQYLAESDMSMTDIAYSCGFNSIATFNRTFKHYTGATPSAYRAGKSYQETPRGESGKSPAYRKPPAPPPVQDRKI